MSGIGLFAQAACIWEVTARKPGNVHRFSDHADNHYVEFLLSAAAIAPVLSRAREQRIGQTILDAVRETRRVARSNTNLGLILLLAPLAAVPEDDDLAKGIAQVLNDLDVTDSILTYEAIRLAAPGGLGKVASQDITSTPTEPLRKLMFQAAERDLIARQYGYWFDTVLSECLTILPKALETTGALENAIIRMHLQLLRNHGDSLIARKRGHEESEQAKTWARRVLAAGWPDAGAGRELFAEFDAWLRAEGNQRNPGATADLVGAALFAALRVGILTLPPRLPW